MGVEQMAPCATTHVVRAVDPDIPTCSVRCQHAQPGHDVVLVAEVLHVRQRQMRTVGRAPVGHGIGAGGKAIDLELGQFTFLQQRKVGEAQRRIVRIDKFGRGIGGSRQRCSSIQPTVGV